MTYDEELEHYGILGMKWGVRRTPEQLGHRLQKYKEKEFNKAHKRTEREWDERIKQMRKAKKSKDKKKIKKIQDLMDAGRKHNNREFTYLANMTVDDMKRERRAAGKSIARSALITLGSTVLSTLGVIPFGLASIPSPDGAKRKVRDREIAKRDWTVLEIAEEEFEKADKNRKNRRRG